MLNARRNVLLYRLSTYFLSLKLDNSIMKKRNHNFGEKSIKKPKLDDDIDALWGDDDIDESALDNCIKLATQVLEEVCW